MKAPRFSYARPDTIAEAVRLLADSEHARVLAGGQSLMPALNFRLDAPELLVDINRVQDPGIAGVSVVDDDAVHVGALTRHVELQRSAVVAEHLPLLATAICEVAHTAVRNRGTFGGSIALADPAAELPACCLAYDAVIVVAGPSGERRIDAEQFFLGLFETALQDDEIITAIEFARYGSPHNRHAFAEISRRRGDYAMAGVALTALADDDGQLNQVRAVLFGVADQALRIKPLEDCLNDQLPDQALAQRAAASLDGAFEPAEDLHASAAMKLHLSKVLVRRAVVELAAGAT